MRCVLCCGAGFVLVGGLCRAESVASVAESVTEPVITSIQQFWNLKAEQRKLPQKLQLECLVIYFDSAWKILFVQDTEGNTAYIPYGNNSFPFSFGQRILATGPLDPPNADISFARAVIEEKGRGTPEPISIAGKLGEAAQFAGRYVTVEGRVESLRRLLPHNVQITLLVDEKPLTVWLLLDPAVPIADLEEAVVRFSGVFNPKLGVNGRYNTFEVLVSGPEHVTVLSGLKDDPRFQIPVVPISSLVGLQASQLVRISGRVKAQESGRFVQVRDDTGQIDILTPQVRKFGINEQVEAIGYPLINGTEWRLDRGLLRSVPSAAVSPKAVPDKSKPLRIASQVLELSAEEAIEGRPVWLTGVVTWSNVNTPFFFIHDSSGGVCIMRAKSNSAVRSVGRNLEIHGVTGMGQFAPVVMATDFERVSDVVLPVAKQISLEHALTGLEEAQWVEMRGYLRQAIRREGWNQLELATAAGDFTAMLPEEQDVDHFVGSVVRLHGVCTASATEERKLTGIKLWVPSVDYVQVEEPAPKDLFDVPIRSLASLGQFGGFQPFSRRLRVSGIVLHHTPGHLIYIQEGNDTLVVFSRGQERLIPGDRIEAVGFLGRQGGRMTLRESVYRNIGHAPQPVPREISDLTRPADAEDGRLVALEGDLIEHSAAGDEIRLTLQKQGVIFEAIMAKSGLEKASGEIENGSRLALTGVYVVKYDEYGAPASFQLRLRSAGDIAVLKKPSWLTRQRILFLAGTLSLGTLVFVAWVTALRRRVKIQTKQIREQLERELWLKGELQRASKLESLGLLAGGIAHDFNNLLTVMMGNLSLTKLDENLTADSVESLCAAELATLRARDLTQQLLTFAKGGAPLRVAVSLPEVVREVAEFAMRGSKTRCEFDLPGDLWSANVDKGQIGQVVQNIVINAMQAMPAGGLVKISLRNEIVGEKLSQVLTPGRYVKLCIMDNGSGIAPEDLQKIFDPYFTTKKQGNGLGLATVYSIVKKHLGHISAESVLGQGTTFMIWLPAAEKIAEEEAAVLPMVTTQFPAVKKQASILFMDDDETIRKVGVSLLKRLGHQVTAVSDGTEALREYARARQERKPFDLVIFDLTIPGGMGGREAMEKLLVMDPGVKAIVSSGYSNDLVLSNYRAHGFRGMVSKPYEIADLAHAIEQVLKGDRA